MPFLGYIVPVRKEVLLAIIIGFALGLVITFGIWTANRVMKEKKETSSVTPEVTMEVQPTPSPTTAFNLEIISPEDESLLNEAEITLVGKTQPGAMVVVVSEQKEEIVEADKDGNFELQITLISGTNEISITAFSQEGEEVTKTLRLVYSKTEI